MQGNPRALQQPELLPPDLRCQYHLGAEEGQRKKRALQKCNILGAEARARHTGLALSRRASPRTREGVHQWRAAQALAKKPLVAGKRGFVFALAHAEQKKETFPSPPSGNSSLPVLGKQLYCGLDRGILVMVLRDRNGIAHHQSLGFSMPGAAGSFSAPPLTELSQRCLVSLCTGTLLWEEANQGNTVKGGFGNASTSTDNPGELAAHGLARKHGALGRR